jgi:DNA helicase HerA-like ATPase
MPWEEATELKLLIIFDEVHRLLEKYGGRGGYVALEKAVREFRKWGIGLVMCSQVSSDFKEAIQGNILTEVQMSTKSLTDIRKVESKFGVEYAKRVSGESVGVGMIQNPKFNKGKPYFVEFRPTLHSPHKLTEKELNIYSNFAERLAAIEEVIDGKKKKGEDVFDLSLEFKLAGEKLKTGSFRMAEIYLESLEEKLNLRRGGET